MSDEISKEKLDALMAALFSTPQQKPGMGDMVPAFLGVLVDRAGGDVVITQAQLDLINSKKMAIKASEDGNEVSIKLVDNDVDVKCDDPNCPVCGTKGKQ